MRRGGKKGPANVPAVSTVPLEPKRSSHAPAPLEAESVSQAPPPPREASTESRAPARSGFEAAPRTTTDHPWRDLHPTRVWPD
jgi:hypothetical protein